MAEVEETSDLAYLMLFGIHEKKQPYLDRIYKMYDELFPAESEVERRFRTIMDEIDKTFGKKIRVSVFIMRNRVQE